MSVCFFVPAEQEGQTVEADDTETECVEESPVNSIHATLTSYWAKVNEDVKKVTAEDFKTQVLPLARIKKIMKLDEEVKMISAEAPVLFAKACEIFIHELTLRAWSHTEDNKRRTLQRNDIAMAISRSDQFDFLIDIVPRQDIKFNRLKEETIRTNPPAEPVTVPQQHPSPVASTQVVTQPCAQIVQPSTSTTAATASSSNQPVTLLHQVVNSAGEVQHVPILLTQSQLNMIRLQMQNNPNTPIIIQAQPQAQQQQQAPQIIQVSSQAQHAPQQIYLAQIAGQEES
ncbi:unnamed protein product [Leptosia nina]|uniref:Nuclear transcription factor Y subunit gamma n=1 Tax=Leptosia nina TaxID=320188 RepID=A0AAV1J2A5_9NEOP